MTDEVIEQDGQRVIMTVMKSAGKVSLKLGGQLGERLAQGFAEIGKWPVRKTRGMVHKSVNSGRMSEKRLQSISGGDLHQVRIDGESIRQVTRSLKRAGVNYSIEREPDGAWLHFAGRDNDHIMHAVQRAFNELGLDFDSAGSLERATTIDAPAKDLKTPKASTHGTPSVRKPVQSMHAPGNGSTVRRDSDGREAAAVERMPLKKTTFKARFRDQVMQRARRKLSAQTKPRTPVRKTARSH